MTTVTKVFASIIGFATLAFQVPAVQAAVGAFFAAHPNTSAVVGGVTALLALFHTPQSK